MDTWWKVDGRVDELLLSKSRETDFVNWGRCQPCGEGLFGKCSVLRTWEEGAAPAAWVTHDLSGTEHLLSPSPNPREAPALWHSPHNQTEPVTLASAPGTCHTALGHSLGSTRCESAHRPHVCQPRAKGTQGGTPVLPGTPVPVPKQAAPGQNASRHSYTPWSNPSLASSHHELAKLRLGQLPACRAVSS